MRDTKKNPPNKNLMFKWFIIHVVVIAALAAGLFMLSKMPKNGAVDNGTIVYLVRHAEKITGENAGRDPALTDAGVARAKTLSKLLRKKNITKIYSSDYIRTRDTATPTAEMSGVDMEIYDPRNLPALATLIQETAGHILVVGHSNTIPETVTALGGVGGTAIFEKSEYDRLYIVTILADGTVQTDLRRYGERYVADAAETTEEATEETDAKKTKKFRWTASLHYSFGICSSGQQIIMARKFQVVVILC